MWGELATVQCTTEAHVQCPICQSQVLAGQINSHIDRHLDQSHSESSNKRQRTSCTHAPGLGCADPASTLAPESFGVAAVARLDNPVPQMPLQEWNHKPELLPMGKHACVSVDSLQNTGIVGGSKMSMPAFVAHGRSLHSAQQQERLSGGAGSSSTSLNVKAESVGEDSAVATLQPEEHLRAHLLGSRTHALRCARDESAMMHAKFSQLCGEVQLDMERRRQDFESYPMITKPTDPQQQCARNALRGDLEDVARTAVGKVNFLVGASCERDEALHTAEAAQLKKIDSVMDMLERLRAETVEEFQMCKEEEALKRKASEAAVLALQPPFECLDSFVRHLAEEVFDEAAKAIQVHKEKLENLQREQVRFVNANDSPQRNPIYAKVIEDIASTERVLEEHGGHSAPYQELLQGWEEVLEKMPSPKQVTLVAIPQKRTLLDHILGRSRSS